MKTQSLEEAKKTKYKWFPYNKGGVNRKWFGNMEYGMYKLQTSINEAQDRLRFIKDCVERINKNNLEQGKNGTYFGHAYRDTATIRNILVQGDIKYSSELIASIIAVVSDTVLKSKESVREKIDAISLLICIAIFIVSKCSNDANYVVRMVCKRESQKNSEEVGDLEDKKNSCENC